MNTPSSTPRVATILIRAPAAITDQTLADRLWHVLRGAIPAEPSRPDMLVPDAASLEVHCTTIPAEEDAFLRRTVFGTEPRAHVRAPARTAPETSDGWAEP